MDGPVRMTPLTWVAGAFRAQVLAARLESEGIDAQLRGALDSPYGLTMGDMARVDVYVPEDQLDDALAAPGEWWGADERGTRHRSRWLWWVALALLVVSVVGALVGAMRHW